jgi:tetratricopeptide (TPR) repeat protein
VLLLLDYWPLRRLSFPALQHSSTPALRLLLEKLPFLALSAASSFITLLVQKQGGAVAPFEHLPLASRLSNGAVAYVLYVFKALWPNGLAIYYPFPPHRPGWQVAGAALLLAAVSICVLLARRRPYLRVGWFWFVGMLVPMIGLVQVGDQSMADRYTYLPLVGLFIVLTWSLAEASARWPLRRFLLGSAATALLVACGILCRRQVFSWQNNETLFRHAAEVTQDNYLAYNNLGLYGYWEKGRTEEAIENYRKSLAIRRTVQALNNLGVALASQRRYSDAIDCYNSALQIQPDHAKAHNNLGAALAKTGRTDEAIKEYETALRLRPDDPEVHHNLGLELAHTGKTKEAIEHYQAALRLRPDYSEAHSQLAKVFAEQGNVSEAVPHFYAALEAWPDNAALRFGLANALAAQNKFEDAAEQFAEALRLKPDNPELHYHLALALERLGRQQQAVAHLKQALQLKPGFTEASRRLESLSAPATP